jgi:hypothetical protein
MRSSKTCFFHEHGPCLVEEPRDQLSLITAGRQRDYGLIAA